ncbi:MAG: CpsD/CapB family tyrosine-protein kinase [Clostridiales bacterium]|nr:CpsD/CapB family tyrosine-protein kinase [Clostridiales bacterium]
MKKLLDLYRHKNQTLNDAFDRIVVNIHLQKQKNGYKSFLLVGTEPMVGTTTIAINLAISLSVSGWKTILIDGDMRKDIEFKRLNEEAEINLSDYLSGHAEQEDIIYDTNWELLDYIPCVGKEESPVRLLCSTQMELLLKNLEEEYDFIIFDLPSMNSAVDSHILAAKCDAVCLVASLGDSSKTSLFDAKKTLDGIGANTIGVIANKVDKREYKQHMKNFDYFKKYRYAKANHMKRD